MGFNDLAKNIGKLVWVLGASQAYDGSDGYSYRIYPVELEIKEVRLGRAPWLNQDEVTGYGPGDVILLCQRENGRIEAFSPINDELLSCNTIAGRSVRAFFDKNDLIREAEILKDSMLKTYKKVVDIEICFPVGFFDDEKRTVDTVISDATCEADALNKATETSMKKMDTLKM